MRIAINLRRWIPGEVGGIENYVRAVVGGLAAGGHELTLFVLDPAVDASREIAPCAELRVARVSAIERSIRRELNPRAHDVLFCPQLGLDPLKPGLPSVAMIPDLVTRLVPDTFDVKYRKDRERLVAATLRAATTVLTLSSYSREAILDAYAIEPERVVVTYCDVKPQFRDPPPIPLAFAALCVPHEYVYFPANFWGHKNHATLLAAFALLVADRPELRLLLTGAPSTGGERVLRHIRALGLGGHVRMLGIQPSEVVVALMRQARVLVFPSLFEGFGIPPLEAFHLGTPVVASGVTGNAEVVGDAAMIVDPTDPVSIADGIARVLDDVSLRAELIERGRARIPKFSWQRTVEVVERALRDAAAQGVPADLRISRRGPIRVPLPTPVYNRIRFPFEATGSVLRATRDAISASASSLAADASASRGFSIVPDLDQSHQRHLADILRDNRERLAAARADLAGELEERRIPTHPILRRLLAIEARELTVENALLDDLDLRTANQRRWWWSSRRHMRARVSGRLRGLVAPRLGVHYHHPPNPLTVPTYYLATDPPCPAPTISIVTPSFGQGEYIERTLYSVLNQNYPALEYVVQDGGSTDATVEILRRYAPFLASWASEPDEGQADAINRGFDRTSGEIMAYLNSDDLLLPGSLAYVASYFAAHPDVDAVYGHRMVIDADDGQVGIWVLPSHDADVMTLVDFVPQETLFWRRSAWEKAGGQIDTSLDFAIDWDLLLRLHESGAKFVRLPRFLGAFRFHEQQKSTLLEDLFLTECDTLRRRVHGRTISHDEAVARVAPYLRRHVVHHLWERLNMVLHVSRSYVRTQSLEPWYRGPERSAGLGAN